MYVGFSLMQLFCSFSFSLSRNLVLVTRAEELDVWAHSLLPIPVVTRYSSCRLRRFVVLSLADFGTFALGSFSRIQLCMTMQFRTPLLCATLEAVPYYHVLCS